jgi:CTP-dependent riboflavin kinase
VAPQKIQVLVFNLEGAFIQVMEAVMEELVAVRAQQEQVGQVAELAAILATAVKAQDRLVVEEDVMAAEVAEVVAELLIPQAQDYTQEQAEVV